LLLVHARGGENVVALGAHAARAADALPARVALALLHHVYIPAGVRHRVSASDPSLAERHVAQRAAPAVAAARGAAGARHAAAALAGVAVEALAHAAVAVAVALAAALGDAVDDGLEGSVVEGGGADLGHDVLLMNDVPRGVVVARAHRAIFPGIADEARALVERAARPLCAAGGVARASRRGGADEGEEGKGRLHLYGEVFQKAAL